MKSPVKVAKNTKAALAVRKMQREFVGTQMSNFLHNIAQDAKIPYDIRLQASGLQKKWDSVSTLRLTNPIVIIELERKLFGK